jgi:hypothetical protein
MMYLCGKAHMLPHKAREFFDNFNWQRLQRADANPRFECFAELISRLYNFEKETAGAYPGSGIPGLVYGGGGHAYASLRDFLQKNLEDVKKSRPELIIIRPNIEHNMLGIIMVSLQMRCSFFVFLQS